MHEKSKKRVVEPPRAGWEGLDPNSEIGSKLKALYSSLQDEPIPERFLDLLDRLDESERRKESVRKSDQTSVS